MGSAFTKTPHAVKWFLILIVFVLFMALWFLKPIQDPKSVIKLAQTTLKDADSYRFSLLTRTIIDNHDNIVSKIKGEYIKPCNYHLYGHLYDYHLDLYQKDGELIFLEPSDSQWRKPPEAPSLVTEAILFSTSPVLDFLATDEFNFVARTKDRGEKIYHFTSIINETSNPHWKIFFSHFQLDCYISQSDQLVRRLRLNGSDQEQQNNLLIDIEFYDYNELTEIIIP